MHACTACYRKLLQSWQKVLVVKQKYKLLQLQRFEGRAAARQNFQARSSQVDIKLDIQILLACIKSRGG